MTRLLPAHLVRDFPSFSAYFPTAARPDSSMNERCVAERMQASPRSGPLRNGGSVELHSLPESSASLSEAMGTASPFLPPRDPSELTAKSTPSSDSLNQSNQIRPIQLPWDMGISGAGGPNASTSYLHALLSPAEAHISLLPFEGSGARPGHSSPYSPATSITELPEQHASTTGMSSSYPASVDRYYQQRPASSAAVHSPMMLSYSHPQPSSHSLSNFQVPPPPPQHVSMSSSHGTPSPPTVFASPMDEVERLRRVVRDMQSTNRELHSRCEQLQGEVTASRIAQSSGLVSPAETVSSQFPLQMNGYPSHANLTPQMEASWRRRTDARIRKFCSPNRAGNALCAWHDTRRERRAYPPRMAPPGLLNCGCSVAEALFEESLSRHGVGSYLPGDSVRMDPALRNPLLRLLEERYGYRDGDFERNPETGEWVDGEGHEYWEAELHRSAGNRHR